MAEHCIIIPRVSTTQQRAEDQTPALLAYAEQQGYAVDAVVPIEGRSAFHGRHRKAILDAVDAHVRKGVATVVILRHVDRLSRLEPEDGMRFFLKIRDAGARVEFSEQGGHVPFEFMALFLKMAHEESKVKQDRKLQGNRQRRAAGLILGSAPWGYEYVTDANGVRTGMVPTTEGRQWIPWIYASAIEGKTLRWISERMTGNATPMRGGAAWSESVIGRIIHNPTYMGLMTANPNLAYEPLVTADVHRKAIMAIDSRTRKGRGTAQHAPALLKPLCGECLDTPRPGCPKGRSPMYVAGKHQAWQYYRCYGAGPQKKSCGAPNIPMAELDEAVEHIMSSDTRPYFVPIYVPGDDSSERKAALGAKAAAAMAAGDFETGLRLGAEAQAIIPGDAEPRIDLKDSGVTIGEHWRGLTLDEKRDELAKYTVIAWRHRVQVFGQFDVIRRTAEGLERA